VVATLSELAKEQRRIANRAYNFVEMGCYLIYPVDVVCYQFREVEA
jgi:hypothetical protein